MFEDIFKNQDDGDQEKVPASELEVEWDTGKEPDKWDSGKEPDKWSSGRPDDEWTT